MAISKLKALFLYQIYIFKKRLYVIVIAGRCVLRLHLELLLVFENDCFFLSVHKLTFEF